MTVSGRSPGFNQAKEWLKKRWCQEHPNEAHCNMLAEYAAASEEARRAERAAVVRECSEKAEVYRDSATGGMAAIADTIARSIREIATDADNAALDKLLREARKSAVDEMNCTSAIAHALEDGAISDRFAWIFEDILKEQNAAIAALEAPQ